MQHGERAVDGVSAFHADERGDPASAEGPFHLVGGEREPERAGVGADEVVDDVYLLHGDADRFLRAERGRDVDGPELAADSALPQPGDVGVKIGLVLLDVDFGYGAVHQLAVAPRQVVVAVDERDPAVEGACAFEHLVRHGYTSWLSRALG